MTTASIAPDAIAARARRRRASPLPAGVAGRDREHAHAGVRAAGGAPSEVGGSAWARGAHALPLALRRGADLQRGGRARRTPAHELAPRADTVMFCVSKGLGAPVGSLLCGPRGDRRGPGPPPAPRRRYAPGRDHRGGRRSWPSRAMSTGSPTTTRRARRLARSRSPSGSRGRWTPDTVRDEHRLRDRRPAPGHVPLDARRQRHPSGHDRLGHGPPRDPQATSTTPTSNGPSPTFERSRVEPSGPDKRRRRTQDGVPRSPVARSRDVRSARGRRRAHQARPRGASLPPGDPEMLDDLDVTEKLRARRRLRRVGGDARRERRDASTRW